jgi:hypothetical protein
VNVFDCPGVQADGRRDKERKFLRAYALTEEPLIPSEPISKIRAEQLLLEGVDEKEKRRIERAIRKKDRRKAAQKKKVWKAVSLAVQVYWREVLSCHLWNAFTSFTFAKEIVGEEDEFMERALTRFAWRARALSLKHVRTRMRAEMKAQHLTDEMKQAWTMKFFPVTQRGTLYGRIHNHALFGGSASLLTAEDWRKLKAWWERHYGILDVRLDVQNASSQDKISEYLLRYVTRGEEFSVSPIRSSWEDECEVRQRKILPLFKEGFDVAVSADLEKPFFKLRSTSYRNPNANVRSNQYDLPFFAARTDPPLQHGSVLAASSLTRGCGHVESVAHVVCEQRSKRALSRLQRRRARGHSSDGLHLFVSQRGVRAAAAK